MPVTTRAASRRATSSTQTTPAQLVQAMPETFLKTKSRTTVNGTRKATKSPHITTAHVGQDTKAPAIAQDPRWEALIAAHPPLQRLPAAYCTKSDNPDLPHLMYGWAYDRPYMLEIARRRRLTFQPGPGFRHRFGGCEEFNFGDLTEVHLSNARVRSTLQMHATMRIRDYIQDNTRAHFTLEEPLSMRWDVMLVLWNNHDIDEEYRRFRLRGGRLAKLKEFMDELMNECLPSDSERSEPMWWWSLKNGFLDGVR